MSINTSHTPDGAGILIYNGEMILLYSKHVVLDLDNVGEGIRGKKTGSLYLTSHRIIFTNNDPGRDRLISFCMPFHCVRDVRLEQPIFGANYLKGVVLAQPGGNWYGEGKFKLTFNHGGCIDFGHALLKAVEMASRFQSYTAPPPYTPPAGGFFSPPPAYYTPAPGYQGFNAPTQAFPDAPPQGNVYMYESPPPYSGIGPNPPPYPAGQVTNINQPPVYEDALRDGVRMR